MNGKQAKRCRKAALMVYAANVMPEAKRLIAAGEADKLPLLKTPKDLTKEIKRRYKEYKRG